MLSVLVIPCAMILSWVVDWGRFAGGPGRTLRPSPNEAAPRTTLRPTVGVGPLVSSPFRFGGSLTRGELHKIGVVTDRRLLLRTLAAAGYPETLQRYRRCPTCWPWPIVATPGYFQQPDSARLCPSSPLARLREAVRAEVSLQSGERYAELFEVRTAYPDIPAGRPNALAAPPLRLLSSPRPNW